jgi:glyoxylase-like metal-dependent hydrolase (beta-lactamase superfamily II)
VNTLQVGEITLTTLFDGAGVICPLDEAYAGPTDESWQPYRALYPELFSNGEWRLPVTCALLRADGRTMLVDAGAGAPGWWDDWRPDLDGRLPSSLRAAGVEPADVDAVFLTHFDADHIGWLDGATFAHARLLATADAAAFALAHTSREWLRRELAAPSGGRVEIVAPGDEVLPGVVVVAYPGHVPGHVGLEVVSNGARALLIADTVPHAALLERLDWRFTFDQDVELAAQTRATVVESIVDTDTVVVCGHFPGSGIGRVVRRDGLVVWEELA